ncbi:MAG: MFS transporter [Chloroflexi bacterium]|nr:MFS transporter [Chloroflexota bacterium]
MDRSEETAIQPKEASPYRWIIGAALLPLHVAIGLNLFAPAPLFPLIREDYLLSRGLVSLLLVLVFLSFTVFLIPGGLIAARIGTRKAIIVSSFLMAAGAFAVMTPNFAALLPLRVVFGMGGGILFPATSSVIVQWFRPNERPILNALFLAGQGTGVATAMFISVPLADALEWRMVFTIYGLFALLGATVWLLLGRTPPLGTAPVEALPMRAVLGVLKERNTLLLSLALVGPFAMFIGYSSWLPTYYNEEFDMPLRQGNSLLAIPPLMGIVVNILSGFLLARLGLRRPMLLIPGLLFPVSAFGAFYFDSTPVIIGAILLMGLSFWLFLPTVLTIAMELPGVSSNKVAMITAAALTFGNLSTIVAPLFVGVTTDMLGSYTPSMSVLAVLPLSAVLAARLLPETGPKGKRSS